MNQRPRVTHVIDTSLPGGAQVQLANLLRGLGQAFEFSVLVLGRRGPFSETWQDLGARVVTMGKAGSRWGLESWQPLVRWLKQERPDLVHTHLFKSNILGAMAARQARLPFIIHDHSGLDRPGLAFYFPNPITRLLYGMAYQRSLAGCRKLLTLTESMRQNVLKAWTIDQSKVAVLPNCIDLEEFLAQARTPVSDIRQELGLPQGTPLVSMVGRLAPEKDWTTFLQVAFMNPQLAFLAVGEGALEKTLKQEAHQSALDNLHFLGWRTDVPSLLAQSNAFLLTSRQEAFGIVLLEAMAAGCPVIATRTQGAEALLQEGINGLLVPVSDVQGCHAALGRVMQEASLANNLKKNALSGLQAYDLQPICDRLATLYREILAEGT